MAGKWVTGSLVNIWTLILPFSQTFLHWRNYKKFYLGVTSSCQLRDCQEKASDLMQKKVATSPLKFRLLLIAKWTCYLKSLNIAGFAGTCLYTFTISLCFEHNKIRVRLMPLLSKLSVYIMLTGVCVPFLFFQQRNVLVADQVIFGGTSRIKQRNESEKVIYIFSLKLRGYS